MSKFTIIAETFSDKDAADGRVDLLTGTTEQIAAAVIENFDPANGGYFRRVVVRLPLSHSTTNEQGHWVRGDNSAVNDDGPTPIYDPYRDRGRPTFEIVVDYELGWSRDSRRRLKVLKGTAPELIEQLVPLIPHPERGNGNTIRLQLIG